MDVLGQSGLMLREERGCRGKKEENVPLHNYQL